jgi:hypothetical protein
MSKRGLERRRDTGRDSKDWEKRKISSLSAKKIESLSEDFKRHMERKKDSAAHEKSEKSTPKKSVTDTPKSTIKNVMKDARKLQTQRDISRDTKSAKSKSFKVETGPDGSIREIDSLIKKLQAEIPKGTKRTSHLELNLDGLSPDKIQKLKQSLKDNKSNFAKKVSDQYKQIHPNEEVRVGVVDNRVYLWRPDKSKNDMLNAWHGVSLVLFQHSRRARHEMASSYYQRAEVLL